MWIQIILSFVLCHLLICYTSSTYCVQFAALVTMVVAGSGRGVSATSGTVLHYAVVMDAGSSGTRAYIYSWPQHSGDPHQLLK